MRAYLALIRSTLRLTMRDRVVLFFNYLFPLLLFVGLGEVTGAKAAAGSAVQLFSMVMIVGILGNGLFGGGLRAAADREANILRRFKIAPIGPAPIVTASVLAGWVVYIPSIAGFWALMSWRYQMPGPQAPVSLFLFISLGVIAFRCLGAIVASVVNSPQESSVVVQLFYLPMLMLSGATIPLDLLPAWLQAVSQFIPSTHLYLGMQGILMRGETLAENWQPALALLVSSVICFFISVKLFRWEKGEKVKAAARLWVAAALLPFIAAGVYQAYARTNLTKVKTLTRERARAVTWLIRDARLFIGDGRVVESGGLLVRNGKIEQVYEGSLPDEEDLRAEPVEAMGKTVLPGLIDSGTSLLLDGGEPASAAAMERALKAYLYCGVTGIVDATASAPPVAALRLRQQAGEIAGPEIFRGSKPSTALALGEIAEQLAAGRQDFLRRSLYQQVLPAGSTVSPRPPAALPPARQSASLPLQPGSPASAGGAAPFVIHGPLLHREMQLWVQAGRPAADVLAAATARAAARAGAGARAGLLRPGFEANLLIVEGNPLEEIAATERIWRVMYRGELVNRATLFEDDRKKK